MKLGDFKKIAHQQATVGSSSSSRRSGRDAPTTYSTEVLAELEKKFWSNILFNPPMTVQTAPSPKVPPSLPHRPSLHRAAQLFSAP